jgi:endonuclease/exonuclease/phosphatase family metal-dependent hydrolase
VIMHRRIEGLILGLVLVWALATPLAGCPTEQKPPHAPQEPRAQARLSMETTDPAAGLAMATMGPVSARPETVVLRAHHRLGVPLHPRARSRAISGRLPHGAVVRVLAERFGGKWLQVRAKSGKTGWIVRRYLALRTRARPGPRTPGGHRPWGSVVVCPGPPARGPHVFRAAEVPRMVTAGKGTTTPLPATLVVASYNVWELYDGYGGDRYYSRHHADSLTPTDVKLRVAKLAAELRAAKPHVIAFQEIEDAKLACRVAARAMPGVRWRCAAGAWKKRSTPQNLAIATRVGGTARILTPRSGFAPRGVVELELPGSKLRVLTVHLKSSRGARGFRDCRNANRRRALADAIVAHLRGAKGASVVIGDFNFDPLRVGHDHTDDVLRKARFSSLRQRFYPGGAPSTYPSYRSTIDLAFFRPGGGVTATGFRVLTKARVNRWTSDHVPVVATFKLR